MMLKVRAVLKCFFFPSKRSNFITRLSTEKKQGLVQRLTHLAEVRITASSMLMLAITFSLLTELFLTIFVY